MKYILVAALPFAFSFSFAEMPDLNALKEKAVVASEKAEVVKQKALVNLNTAKKEDLAKLPGVGESKAQAIVEARPFNEVSDLKKVKGFNEGLISKLKGLVSVK